MRNNSTDELYGTLFILQVMTRQIARSGYDRYFVLKGGTALLSMLRENNQDIYLRATQDIDYMFAHQMSGCSLKTIY